MRGPTAITRRRLLAAAAAGVMAPFAGCAPHHDNRPLTVPHVDFDRVSDLELTVLRAGPEDGKAVVLLHELPGMSPDDMWLGRMLAQRGLNVHMPLLFGSVGQNNATRGYFQSCGSAQFSCGGDGTTRDRILDPLQRICAALAKKHGPIGVIGMCLTGIYPLALLAGKDDPAVQATVLCQPTLPFNLLAGRPVRGQKTRLGLSTNDLAEAQQSQLPILVLHYLNDPRCPPDRIDALQSTFEKRVAVIELEGGKHSTLASAFDRRAFEDTVGYLQVRLGSEPAPRAMSIARLGHQLCEIVPGGGWRVRESTS